MVPRNIALATLVEWAGCAATKAKSYRTIAASNIKNFSLSDGALSNAALGLRGCESLAVLFDGAQKVLGWQTKLMMKWLRLDERSATTSDLVQSFLCQVWNRSVWCDANGYWSDVTEWLKDAVWLRRRGYAMHRNAAIQGIILAILLNFNVVEVYEILIEIVK